MIRGFVRGTYPLVEKQKYSNVGSQPFRIIAYRDPALFLARDLRLYTDEAGTTTLKYQVDYEYGAVDQLYSRGDFAKETVLSSLRIINPIYQNTSIWITYRWVADYVSDEMMNRFDRGLDQMINSIVTEVDTSIVVDNSGNVVAAGERYPGYREEL